MTQEIMMVSMVPTIRHDKAFIALILRGVPTAGRLAALTFASMVRSNNTAQIYITYRISREICEKNRNAADSTRNEIVQRLVF